MPFAYVMQNLSSGKAAKRPSWGGYVKKNITSESDAETETYTLTFVKRDGTNHVYTWNGSTFVAPDTMISLDDEFLSAMLADDWITGDAVAFETARSGSGDW